MQKFHTRKSVDTFCNTFFVCVVLLCIVEEALCGVVTKDGAERVSQWIGDTSNGQKWVEYVFDESLSFSTKSCLENAMAEIQKHSCVEFDDEQYNETALARLHFFQVASEMQNGHCKTWASYSGNSVNLTLESNCAFQERFCIRALLDTFGLAPEIWRYDRDRFVKIDRANVEEAQMHLYTRVLPSEKIDFATDYDASSIMHFDPKEHSKYARLAVISTRDPLLDDSIGGLIRGRRDSLSFRDKKTLNYLFRCASDGKDRPLGNLDCQRGGFLNSAGRCVCPPAFSGEHCEILAQSKLFNVQGCGVMNDKREGDILSPNYPQRYPGGVFCQWLIETKSPEQRIAFRFNRVDLEYEYVLPTDRCADKLTVWPHGNDVVTQCLSCFPEDALRYDPDRWSLTQQNRLLIEFRSDPWGSAQRKGFNISYKIIDPTAQKKRPPPTKNGLREQWRRGYSTTEPKTADERRSCEKSDYGNVAISCYRCENETRCENVTDDDKQTCAFGETCGVRFSQQNKVVWRGCITVESCKNPWSFDAISYLKDSCFHCCESDMCNAVFISTATRAISSISNQFFVFTFTLFCVTVFQF